MTTKAQVIKFNYAGIQIEGLLLPSGERRIALAQVSSLILESRKLSTKQLETMTGMTFKSHEKVSTELGRNKSVTIDFTEFSEVVYHLAVYKNNSLAQNILKASTHQTISNAFDVALGIEKVNRDLVADFNALVKSKETRRNLTDTWQECYALTGEFPTYGTHTLKTYEKLGLKEQYLNWKESYTDRERRTHTFRHHELNKAGRDILTTAETNIKFMIEKLNMTVDEAIEKL